MTKKGYITSGLSGWRVCFWNGAGEVRFLCGFATWDVALVVLQMFWRNPPDFQNGFCTIVEL